MNAKPNTLEIRRRKPQRAVEHGGRPVRRTLYLRLRGKAEGGRPTLATLTPVPLVEPAGGGEPAPLPADRARAWEELSNWICHYLIYPDPTIQGGQHRNRLLWQRWTHQGAPRPRAEDQYDWRRDEETLARLRLRFVAWRERLVKAIGRPRLEDFERLYPNELDDLGPTEAARRAVRELRAVFGPDFVRTDST